jgi:hypothetical protein
MYVFMLYAYVYISLYADQVAERDTGVTIGVYM